MRISTQQQYLSSITNLQNGQARMAEVQEQLATGKRISKPSDDPIAAAQIVKLQRELAQYEKFDDNIDVTKRRLDQEETILDSLNNATDRMRELAISAGSTATLGDADRKALANELRTLADYAAGLMNTRDSQGEYLFSGSKGLTQPYEKQPDGRYEYQGDEGQRLIQVAPSLQVASNDSGQFLFEAVGNGFDVELRNQVGGAVSDFAIVDKERYAAFNPAGGDIQLDVYLTDANPAEYAYRMTDRNGDTLLDEPLGTFTTQQEFEVEGMEFTLNPPTANELEFAQTPEINGVQDVALVDAGIAQTYKEAYGELQLTFDGAGEYEVRYPTVDENGNPVNALVPIPGNPGLPYTNDGSINLGGYEVQLGTPQNGDSYTFIPGEAEPVSNVADVQISNLGDFTSYAAANTSLELEFRNVTAAGFELFVGNPAASAGTFNYATIPFDITGTGLSFTVDGAVEEGEKLTLELTKPKTGALLDITERKDNLLDVAISLAETLEQPLTSETKADLEKQVAESIGFFETASERNLEARTTIGSRLTSLENVKENNADFTLFTESVLSGLQDLDYAEAAGRFQLETLIMQAAQASFAKIQNLSLFNYLN